MSSEAEEARGTQANPLLVRKQQTSSSTFQEGKTLCLGDVTGLSSNLGSRGFSWVLHTLRQGFLPGLHGELYKSLKTEHLISPNRGLGPRAFLKLPGGFNLQPRLKVTGLAGLIYVACLQWTGPPMAAGDGELESRGGTGSRWRGPSWGSQP